MGRIVKIAFLRHKIMATVADKDEEINKGGHGMHRKNSVTTHTIMATVADKDEEINNYLSV